MTSFSTDPRVLDERARSRARLGRLVAALLLGLAALTGTALERTSSLLTDQLTVDLGVTTAPDFSPTASATPTASASASASSSASPSP